MSQSEDKDDVVVTKVGEAVRQAMSSKQELQYALSEALDASSTFGYELGILDGQSKIIEWFENSDSACADWALAQIQEAINKK